MATVINNPTSEGSGAGTMIGVLVGVVLVVILLLYGIPALRNRTAANSANPGPSASVNVNLPATNGNVTGTASGQ